MSRTAATLLTQANLHRRHADRARRMACSFSTPEVIERLEQFARELDDKASELERRARALSTTLGRTRRLAVEIRELAQRRPALEISVPANDNAS